MWHGRPFFGISERKDRIRVTYGAMTGIEQRDEQGLVRFVLVCWIGYGQEADIFHNCHRMGVN